MGTWPLTWLNNRMVADTEVFITGAGAFLPGEPVGNDRIEELLGSAGGRPSLLKDRVLAANGIRSRHYALDAHGNTTMLNEALAAEAVRNALADRGLPLEAVGMLATGTTQGDLLVPGFASMVHGRLGGHPMELLSAGGVCGSGMAALKAAASQVRLGEHAVAVAVGSELISRALRASRFDAAGVEAGAVRDSGDRAATARARRSRMDAEFLRWTLSDGAGAVVIEHAPRPDRPSLRLDWVHLVSHAHEHDVCMRAGMAADAAGPAAGGTWLDRPNAVAAERDGMLLLRQEVRVLPDLARLGCTEFLRLVKEGWLEPDQLDHVLCHYSAEHFRADIFRLLDEAGLGIPAERWFTNLHTKGNTGAASVFVMLEECWRSGRFTPGDTVLLVVPESGRFSFSFAHLTCVDPASVPAPVPHPVNEVAVTPATGTLGTALPAAIASPAGAADATGGAKRPAVAPSPLGGPRADDGDVVRWTVLELAEVWAGFERRLRQVPVVRRIETGSATIDDYRRLLVNLRQQVMEGSRWIARAASNFSVELFPLRSAAIHHAGEEHRDYQILEEDFVAVGGDLDEIRRAPKNIGSEALSAFMFHQASQPDPIDLLGAMFIIEGLGTAKALGWATRLQEQLGLRDDQVRFMRYHGEEDDAHFEQLRQLLRSGVVDKAAAARIVKTAKVVARLYALQLEELDNA
jgi:3-oxoacyl-[acyl-carrier-protein] synthase-3